MLWLCVGGFALIVMILMRPFCEDARYQNEDRRRYLSACKYCRIDTTLPEDPDKDLYLIKD